VKKTAFLVIVAVLFLGCTRRPVQSDLPKSEGNSVDHSRPVTISIESSPNAAASPYGAQFLDTMIADHEALIDVLQLVQTRAGSTDVKNFTRTLIEKQQAEIKLMRRLRQMNFASFPLSVNADLPGIKEGLLTLDPDKLDLLKGQAFDKEFLLELVRHHEGSLELLKDASIKLGAADSADELRESVLTAANDRRDELEQMKKLQVATPK
jgi:uncharacterized protein (DUF305 family)